MDTITNNIMKDIDYYAVLDIPRNAKIEEIALAYRKLAIQHHPCRDRNRNETIPLNPPEGINEVSHLPGLSSAVLWGYVNKAYDILSNPLRRQIYDTYGEAGLDNGVLLPDGRFVKPYIYHGNYFQTYSEVFGSYSPYANMIDAIINPLCTGKRVEKTKCKTIEAILALDLVEIYQGVTKRLKILRTEFVDANNKTITDHREKILNIDIPAGTLTGTKIICKEEGDRSETNIPADIAFIITEKPHQVFSRKLHDLYMNYEIDLKQALCGFKLKFNSLDGRQLCYMIHKVIQPNCVIIIKGEGLPIPNENNKKGDLHITFKINFPIEITRNFKLKFLQAYNELLNEQNRENEETQV